MSVIEESALVYRPLREEHIQSVMKIENEAYPEPWTVGMFREEMKSSRSYFRLAYAKGELVGYAGYWLVVDEAHITSVTVAIDQRGKGYGSEQLDHLLDHAIEEEARIATLEVRDSNVAARALYESRGFNAVGLRRGYYSKTNEDAIVMVKEFVAT